MKSIIPTTLMYFAASMLIGCAKYEYTIVDPPEFAQQIVHKQDTVFSTANAEYRLRAVEDRLVMHVFNFGQTPLRIDATKSYVVSPDGQSRPILGQTAAPGSFVKLILPPPRPVVEPDGPGVYYGFGYSTGYYEDHSGGRRYSDRGDRYREGTYRPRSVGRYSEPAYYDPPSYTVYDRSNPLFWDWSGETQIRLTLAFDRDGATSEDRFVIQRVKVE